MSKQILDRGDHGLQAGWVVSISQLSSLCERVATVTKSSPEKTWLKLSRPDAPEGFQKGEPVRIKYWDEPAISYWEGKILKVTGQDKQRLTITDHSEGITLGRRRYSRLSLGIPISFKVTHARSDDFRQQEVYSDRIRNMSAGGLSFETELALEVGDELEVELDLPHLQNVCAGGWIVRSKPNENGKGKLHSVALEFLGLGREAEAELLQFLDEHQMGSGAYKLTGLYPAPEPRQRQEQRFQIELMGMATLDSQKGKLEQKIKTRDPSASGGYFISRKSPWVGEKVRLRLQWPSRAEAPDSAFEVVGTVRRIEQVSETACGFAVEFQEIIDLDRMEAAAV